MCIQLHIQYVRMTHHCQSQEVIILCQVHYKFEKLYSSKVKNKINNSADNSEPVRLGRFWLPKDELYRLLFIRIMNENVKMLNGKKFCFYTSRTSIFCTILYIQT